MTISIREARSADEPGVIGCMTTVFEETHGRKTSEFGAALWKWQYLESPLRSTVVVAEAGGEIVGYYHALVFEGVRAGERALMAMVQDVGTLAAYRGKGIFRDMGGHALTLLRERGVHLVYTFPNDRSRPSFLRNHAFDTVGLIPVRVALLAPASALSGRFGLPRVARTVDWLASPLAAIPRRRFGRLQDGEAVASVSTSLTEVAGVFEETTRRRALAIVRSPDYLKWRYLGKPASRYAIQGLMGDGVVRAVVVTGRAPLFGTECITFMDLACTAGEEASLLRLIVRCMEDARNAGAALGVFMGLHPCAEALSSLGFMSVPERFNPRPFHLLTKDLRGEPSFTDPGQWIVTLGDWDVL